VCAAYAFAESLGVDRLSRLLSNGRVPSEQIWFEVLPYPTRQHEGNTNLDLAFGSISLRPYSKGGIQLLADDNTAICFCECKWLSDISLGVSNDIHRNQMARVIENALLFADASGNFADAVVFTLVTPAVFKNRAQFSRHYQYKWNDYQNSELLTADFRSCGLELRGDLPKPSSRLSSLELNWVSYEELVLGAPPSPLQKEVYEFFKNLAVVEFPGG